MYESVEAYCQVEWPSLVLARKNSGRFWEQVWDNTVTNSELVSCIKVGMHMGRTDNSYTYLAGVALMVGRLTGEIANPG